jgi:hypothetical protein
VPLEGRPTGLSGRVLLQRISDGFDPERHAWAKAKLSELGVTRHGPGDADNVKGYFTIGQNGKATLGTTGATGGYVLPNNLVDTLVKPATQRAVYQQLLTVRNGVNVGSPIGAMQNSTEKKNMIRLMYTVHTNNAARFWYDEFNWICSNRKQLGTNTAVSKVARPMKYRIFPTYTARFVNVLTTTKLKSCISSKKMGPHTPTDATNDDWYTAASTYWLSPNGYMWK